MSATPEQRRAYYLRNRERLIAKAQAYQASRPEASRAIRRRWQDANPLHRHQMKPTEWAELFAAQDGRCYLCGDPLSADRSKAFVDHDHSCCGPDRSCRYCRRGLACPPCNSLVGMASDDPQKLRVIANNLEAALASVRQRIASRPAQEQLDLSATWEQAELAREASS